MRLENENNEINCQIEENAKLNGDSLELSENKIQFINNPSDVNYVKRQKQNITKNLLVVSFSYLFLFSAIFALNNLQSSLNSHANLGIYTLLCSSFSFAISCLFLPAIMIKLFRFKWSMILSQLLTLLFIVSNYYPSFYTLIPASVAYGAALSVLSILQGTFFAHLSHEYATFTKKKTAEKIMFKFFGIFGIIFSMSNFFQSIEFKLVREIL